MVWFLAIFGGAAADRLGFRRALSVAYLLLATAYFLIGVRAAGLAAGPMGGFDRKGVDQEFFDDGRWRSILIVNVGKAAAGGHGERLGRLSFEQVSRIV